MCYHKGISSTDVRPVPVTSMMGIKEGLKIANQLYFGPLVIEMDSIVALKLLSSSRCTPMKLMPIFSNCRLLMDLVKVFWIQHTFRGMTRGC